MFNGSYKTLACDGRTDRQTDTRP